MSGDYGTWGSDHSASNSRASSDTLGSIRQSIQALSREIADYKSQIAGIGGFQDNAQLREEISAKRTSLTRDCQSIKKELQTVRSNCDQVQFDRLSSQFLQQVQRLEGLAKEASVQVGQNPLSGMGLRGGGGPSEKTPLNTMTRPEQQMMEEQVDIDLAEQRKKDLLDVERDMTGLRDAFVDLNNLVQEQGEDIIKIEDAVSSTVDHTQNANSELSQALINQRKARKKCIILAVILFIVLVTIIIIILVATKPWEKKKNK